MPRTIRDDEIDRPLPSAAESEALRAAELDGISVSSGTLATAMSVTDPLTPERSESGAG